MAENTIPTNGGALKHYRLLRVNVQVEAFVAIAPSAEEADKLLAQGKVQRDAEYEGTESIALLCFDRTALTPTPTPAALATQLSQAWQAFLRWQAQREAAAAKSLENLPTNGGSL